MIEKKAQDLKALWNKLLCQNPINVCEAKNDAFLIMKQKKKNQAFKIINKKKKKTKSPGKYENPETI